MTRYGHHLPDSFVWHVGLLPIMASDRFEKDWWIMRITGHQMAQVGNANIWGPSKCEGRLTTKSCIFVFWLSDDQSYSFCVFYFRCDRNIADPDKLKNTDWLFNMVKRDPSWLRNRRVKCFSESRPCRKKRKKRKYGSGAYSNIIYTNTNRCLGRRHCLRLLLLLLTKMTWLVSKQWLYIVPRTLNGPQNKCASR